MRRTSFGSWPCSIARTADILGDAWTLLVLREVFYGESRFDGFIGTLGIARNTLTDRLRRLEAEGLLRRRVYQRDPVRHEYLPTDKGRDFFGVLAAINAWGDSLGVTLHQNITAGNVLRSFFIHNGVQMQGRPSL